MSENYIVINGKRAELTDEQLAQLGIVTEKKNPFARTKCNEYFYTIDPAGEVSRIVEYNTESGKQLFECANYCTDEGIMKQRALHETLNRLLWRYSMEHDGNKIDWRDMHQEKFYIRIVGESKYDWDYVVADEAIPGIVFFYSENIAANAIKEIIEPFMKAHPDFVW